MNARMLTEKITGPQAWTRASISPADWTVDLTPEALPELRAVLRELRRSPVPVLLLSTVDRALAAEAGHPGIGWLLQVADRRWVYLP